VRATPRDVRAVENAFETKESVLRFQ